MADTSWLPESAPTEIPRLALRPREAAQALSVSEKTLWTWTDRGIIPCVRINGTKLYSVDVLRERLRELTEVRTKIGEEVAGEGDKP